MKLVFCWGLLKTVLLHYRFINFFDNFIITWSVKVFVCVNSSSHSSKLYFNFKYVYASRSYLIRDIPLGVLIAFKVSACYGISIHIRVNHGEAGAEELVLCDYIINRLGIAVRVCNCQPCMSHIMIRAADVCRVLYYYLLYKFIQN